MKELNRTKSKYCGNVCLTDDMKNSYFVIADFMLGDADSYTTELQGSFKKINKEMINIVVALEASKGRHTDDMLLGEYLDIPYSESSYWSFEGYKVLFMDKNRDIFDVTIQFDASEMNYIKSENIYR